MRNPLLTAQEVAEILRVSPKSLERWRITGGGPPYVKTPGLRGAVRYDPDALSRWLALRERCSTSDTGETHPRPAA